MTAVMERKRGPSSNSDRVESIGGHRLSTTVARCGRAGIHPDPNRRRSSPEAGEHLFAARFAQLQKVALELVEALDVEHYTRAADLYESWGPRYAELGDPDQARECHSIGTALRQKVELIRLFTKQSGAGV